MVGSVDGTVFNFDVAQLYFAACGLSVIFKNYHLTQGHEDILLYFL